MNRALSLVSAPVTLSHTSYRQAPSQSSSDDNALADKRPFLLLERRLGVDGGETTSTIVKENIRRIRVPFKLY